MPGFATFLTVLGCVASGPGDTAAPTPDDTASPDTATDSTPTDTATSATYVHYMSTTEGWVHPADAAEAPCAGEAHVNVYDDGAFSGFASCLVPADDTASLSGEVHGTAVAGVIGAEWTVDFRERSLVLIWAGTFDASRLSASFAVKDPAVTVSGRVQGDGI